MKKSTYGIACLLTLGMAVACAQACDKATSACAKSKTASSSCCAKSATPGLVTHVIYRVNDQETPCSEMAAKLAEESGAKIVYVAAGEPFDSELAAKSALAEQIEATVANMLQVHYSVNGQSMDCPTSAKMLASKTGQPMMFRAVGRDFANQDKAEQAVAQAKMVLAKLDGDRKGCCAKMAEDTLKTTSVVKKTSCSSAGKIAVTANASAPSCCSSKLKAAAIAGIAAPECCQKKAAAAAAKAAACPKTQAVNAALAKAQTRYDAVVSLSKELVVADASTTEKG